MNWRETPDSIRDHWFNNFKGFCNWNPTHENAVRRQFEETARLRLKDNVNDAGSKFKGKDKPCPDWMTPDVYKAFLERRKDKNFRKRSKQASLNKKKANTTHHYGSIKAIKHAPKMTKLKGKAPTAPELFFDGHSKEIDGERRLTNARAKNIYEQYEKIQNDNREQGKEVSPDEAWFQAVGGYKKGHVYGLGTAASLYYNAPPSNSRGKCSSTPSYVPGILSQVEARANQIQREMMEALQKEAEEHRKFREETRLRDEQTRLREEMFLKTQQEMSQQLMSLSQLFQSQNCNPNPFNNYRNPNDDNSGGGGIGGAGVEFQV